MGEIIQSVDVVSLAIDYLGAQVDGLALGTRVPSPRPARFVVLRRVGGTRSTLVTDAVLIAVECWASTPADASDLAEQCRDLLLALQGTVLDGVPIYKAADVSSPGDLPDPLSDQPRYTFTVELTVRCTAVPTDV